MNDLFDTLKEIKSKLEQEYSKDDNKAKKVHKNTNADEFESVFKEESSTQKENRLKNEFLEFIEHADVKKIG